MSAVGTLPTFRVRPQNVGLTIKLGHSLIQEAVALVGHPEVNVYELPADTVWPGEPGEAVWQCGP